MTAFVCAAELGDLHVLQWLKAQDTGPPVAYGC